MERATEVELDLPNNDDEHLHVLSNFQPVSVDQVESMAKKMCSKSCEFDPIAATVLRNCLPMILPTLTSIINVSLMDGVMPKAFKSRCITPTQEKRCQS